MAIVCTLLDVAVVHRWPLYHMDLKSAFLHGTLSVVVYTIAPPGYGAPSSHACHFCQAIYGLKEASRAWFNHSSIFMLQYLKLDS